MAEQGTVQSTKQATTWINCTEGAEATIWPNLLRGGLGGVVWDPRTPLPLGLPSC